MARNSKRRAARLRSTGCRRGGQGRANDSGSKRQRKAPAPAQSGLFAVPGCAPSACMFAAQRVRRPDVPARRRRAGLAPAGLIALMLAGVAACAWASASETDAAPGTFVDVGSHRLHIHCTGRGSPAVVFESGLGSTSLDWVNVQPEVSRFTRACSYDRAGYGWSESGPEPRHADRIAGELDRLLVRADVPPPYVLVGHSFGGLAVRLFVARKEPRAVAGLVLVDAAHEHQFQRMESAGVRIPMAPTGRRFVIANHGLVPSALPAEPEAPGATLRPGAQGGTNGLRGAWDRCATAPGRSARFAGQTRRAGHRAGAQSATRRRPRPRIASTERGSIFSASSRER